MKKISIQLINIFLFIKLNNLKKIKVIIGAPIETSRIIFDDSIKNKDNLFGKRPMKGISKFIISGEFRKEFFKVSNIDEIPNIIISSERLFGKIPIMRKICKNCYNNVNNLIFCLY